VTKKTEFYNFNLTGKHKTVNNKNSNFFEATSVTKKTEFYNFNLTGKHKTVNEKHSSFFEASAA
jgi:hypothetical protein